MLRYGPVPIDPPLILAPMAGITDRWFRRVIRRTGGVGLVSMEFISSEGIARGNERTLNLMAFRGEERPLAIQIYGSSPERMAEAARLVEEIGADVCDINMGCPANKILKGCAGAALMGDLDLAGRIIRAVRAACRIPVTVKFRAGLDEGRLNYLALGRICEDAGVQAVALHPRTAKQFYSGRADWERIARLREAVSIPVAGNGDVRSADDALALMGSTGCDAVMVGRAAMLNPWIFRQTADRLAGRAPFQPTLAARRALIFDHFGMIRSDGGDTRFILHKLRTFTGWYTRGLRDGRILRQRIQQIDSVDGFFEEFDRFFAHLEETESAGPTVADPALEVA